MAKNNTESLVLAGLLSNATVKATSAATGISESTIYKYLRDDKFKSKYESSKLEMLEQSTNSLQANIQKAINAIVDIIECVETPQQIKLNASDMLLRNSLKFAEQISILQRLDKLEQMQKTHN